MKTPTCVLPRAKAAAFALIIAAAASLCAVFLARATDARAATQASPVVPRLTSVVFPPLAGAFVPLARGRHLFPSSKSALPVEFSRGGTRADVSCAPGRRFDVALPRGTEMHFLVPPGGALPGVMVGDGSGIFVSTSLTRAGESGVLRPWHPTQRHALVTCPSEPVTLGVRLVGTTGRRLPRLTGYVARDPSRPSEPVRRADGFTWQGYQRAVEGAPLGIPTRGDARYLVRVRPVFTRDGITSGSTRLRIVARASPSPAGAGMGESLALQSTVEVRSAVDASAPALADGTFVGTLREMVLSPEGAGAITLECSRPCLVRVEELAATPATDEAIDAALREASAFEPLSLRTLSPETIAGGLSLSYVAARHWEPFVPGDALAETTSPEWEESPLEALRGSDLYARPRSKGALTYALPSARDVRELRISLFAQNSSPPTSVAGAQASNERRASARVDRDSRTAGTEPGDRVYRIVGEETSDAGLTLIWNPRLALAASSRMPVSALDPEALTGGDVVPSSSNASRVVFPWKSRAERLRVEPISGPVSDDSFEPTIALTAALVATSTAPVPAVRVLEARLDLMRRHFTSSGARVGRLPPAARLPADVRSLAALERRIDSASESGVASKLLAERHSRLEALARGGLARAVAWRTVFAHPRRAVSCEAARLLSRSAAERSDFHGAALASYAAYRACAVPADLEAARVAFLRAGAFSSAHELEAILPPPVAASAHALAFAASHRDLSPSAREALRAHPVVGGVPFLHLPTEGALEEAPGFVVSVNNETGVEEARVVSGAATPSRWRLPRGSSYLISWRRLLPEGRSVGESWIVVDHDGVETRLPMGACTAPDRALEKGPGGKNLCEAESFVVALPTGLRGAVTIRPLAGDAAFSVRERFFAPSTSRSPVLTRSERIVTELAEIVARKEKAESNAGIDAPDVRRAVAEGDALFRSAKDPSPLVGLHARLLRRRAWTPVADNILHAGVWREDGEATAWPVGIDDRVERLYALARGVLSVDDRVFRLGAANRMAFRGREGASDEVELRLFSDGVAPLEPQRVRVLRNGLPDRLLALSDDRALTRLRVPDARHGDVLAFELDEVVSGQDVWVRVPGSEEHWRRPEERSWYVATSAQPVKAFLRGPGRLRVEELADDGAVRERFVTLAPGWNPVEVRPQGKAVRARLRLATLEAAQGALDPRPRVDPWTVDNLAAQPALAAASTPARPALPRLVNGETFDAAWRVYSEAEASSRPEGEILPVGERRDALTLGVRRKQLIGFQGWEIYAATSAEAVGVRGRQGLGGVAQKFTVVPDPSFARYSFTANGYAQQPVAGVSRTEWSALTRHELAFPLSFGQRLQVTPRAGFFYRWWSLEGESVAERYPGGEVDSLISNGFYRAHPYGASLGARVQLAPSAALPARVLVDTQLMSGVDYDPMDPARLSGSLRYVHLVGDFDLEAFGEIERSRSRKDAIDGTRDDRTTQRAGAAAAFVRHARGSRLFETGGRGGYDFGRAAPFGVATFTWHLSPDALLRHDAPEDLLMREERLRRMGSPSPAGVGGVSTARR